MELFNSLTFKGSYIATINRLIRLGVQICRDVNTG